MNYLISKIILIFIFVLFIPLTILLHYHDILINETLTGYLDILLLNMIMYVYGEENKSLTETESLSIHRTGISVNSFPIDISVNPLLKHIYVSNQFSNTVSIIDSERGEVLKIVPLESSPHGIDYNILSSKIYVSLVGNDAIAILDSNTGQKIHTINNVPSPLGIKVVPSEEVFYVANSEESTVSKYSTISDDLKEVIHVGRGPYSFALDENHKKLYVTNINNDTISVINVYKDYEKAKDDSIANKLDYNFTAHDKRNDKDVTIPHTLPQRTIKVGDKPIGISVDTTENKIYVANVNNDTISILDGKSNYTHTQICVRDKNNTNNNHKNDCEDVNPIGITVVPKTNMIFTSNVNSNSVSVMNGTTNTIIKEIPIDFNIDKDIIKFLLTKTQKYTNVTNKFPNIASSIVLDELSNKLYVTNTGSNSISVIDAISLDLEVATSFGIKPPKSGYMKCHDVTNNQTHNITTSGYKWFKYGTEINCIAVPEVNYNFVYWSGNSTESSSTNSRDSQFIQFVNSFIHWFRDLFIGEESPTEKFKTTVHGQTLTANFKEGNTVSEYMNILFIPFVFLAAIPAFKWILKKYKLRKKTYFSKRNRVIEDSYESASINQNESLYRLREVRKDIVRDFFNGFITESDYSILIRKISNYILDVTKEKKD